MHTQILEGASLPKTPWSILMSVRTILVNTPMKSSQSTLVRSHQYLTLHINVRYVAYQASNLLRHHVPLKKIWPLYLDPILQFLAKEHTNVKTFTFISDLTCHLIKKNLLTSYPLSPHKGVSGQLWKLFKASTSWKDNRHASLSWEKKISLVHPAAEGNFYMSEEVLEKKDGRCGAGAQWECMMSWKILLAFSNTGASTVWARLLKECLNGCVKVYSRYRMQSRF